MPSGGTTEIQLADGLLKRLAEIAMPIFPDQLPNTVNNTSIVLGSGNEALIVPDDPAAMTVRTDPEASEAVIYSHKGRRYQVDPGSIFGISPSDPTHTRFDVVAIAENGELVTRTGTPQATPVVPTLTDGDAPLAVIQVTAGATSILSSNITDLRTRATLDVDKLSGEQQGQSEGQTQEEQQILLQQEKNALLHMIRVTTDRIALLLDALVG